jgi:DNA-binding GntR family transcriptional regulator
MDVQEIKRLADAPGEGPVSRRVQQGLLAAIADGSLTAGDAVNDQDWAAAFEVSRTPVREAIQHLQSMGLLDVAAARYTRMRTYTPAEAGREAQDWALLHHALAATLMERLPEGLVDRLCRIRDAVGGRTHPDHVRTGHFAFFQAVREAVPHSTVTLGATAAAYRLRLAEPTLLHAPDAHTTLHNEFIDALVTRDLHHAHAALTRWVPRPSPLLIAA